MKKKIIEKEKLGEKKKNKRKNERKKEKTEKKIFSILTFRWSFWRRRHT